MKHCDICIHVRVDLEPTLRGRTHESIVEHDLQSSVNQPFLYANITAILQKRKKQIDTPDPNVASGAKFGESNADTPQLSSFVALFPRSRASLKNIATSEISELLAINIDTDKLRRASLITSTRGT